MTTEVASLKVVFTGDDSQLRSTIAGVSTELQSAGGTLSSLSNQIGAGIMQGIGLGMGLGVTQITAQIAGLGPAMISSAADFDNAFRNVNSILKLSEDELGSLEDQVLGLGANSVAGPQMVAEAFYDIVSGVSDASTHMDILTQAIRTSEAGQADLIGTTNALVSIMNAYTLSAKDAAHVSDVLTETVALGVGSMDAFGGAFSQVTQLGATLGVSLDELGAELAFLTTKGASASEAGTQLASAMTAFIKPSEKMKEALKELGYASGSELIKTEGLAGALQILNDAYGGNVDQISELLGRKEALQAFLAVTGDGFTDFFGKFENGVEGATESARAMQLESVSQQWDMFESKIDAVSMTLAGEFLPAANDAIDVLGTLVDVGAEMLGINLGFDVTGDPPDLAAEAQRIIGPEPPPIEVAQAVHVTIEQGEIPWDVWQSDFSDQMSWEEFSKHYYDAAAAAGLPNPNITSKGVEFDVELAANTTTTTQSTLSLESLNAAIRDTGNASEESTTKSGELAGKLDDLFAKQGMATDFAWAFEQIGKAADIAAVQLDNFTVTPMEFIQFLDDHPDAVDTFITQLDNMTVDPLEAAHAFLDLKDAVSDFADNAASWIETAAARIEVGFLDIAISGADAVNSIIDSFNSLGEDVLGKLGIDINIDEIDTSEWEEKRQEIIDDKLTPEVQPELAPDWGAAIMQDYVPIQLPITPEIDPNSAPMEAFDRIGTMTFEVLPGSFDTLMGQVEELQSQAATPLTITVGEDSYASVTDFSAAVMAGTYDAVTEPLPITISSNAFVQADQLNTDVTNATRDRDTKVNVTSNIGDVALQINNTVQDRIMKITLQLDTVQATGVGHAIEPHALGGPAMAGETILVGENGPELFTPNSNGQIIPNHDLMALDSGGSGGPGGSGAGGVNINGGTYYFYGIQDVAGFFAQMREHAQGLANPGFAMEGSS